MTDYSGEDSEGCRDGLTRRTLIHRGAQGAALLGAGGLLAACGGNGATSKTTHSSAGLPTSTGTGTPVRGGTMTVGGITGGTAETLNPIAAAAFIDVLRTFQLFDTLFLPSGDLQSVVPRLAVSAEPNKDASVWTIRLRKGVKFHDGTPFTADDVIYSMRYWSNPIGLVGGLVQIIDFASVRKRDALTLEVPLHSPDPAFPARTTAYPCAVVKRDAKPSDFNRNPIGTGPFKFVSFAPGQRSVFAANENYWESGKPYLGKLVIDSSFQDETSRLNALLSGAIDLLPFAATTSARQQLASGSVTVFGSPSLQPTTFIMRVDKGPFADVRVRQAMKLIADRQALIDGALSGFGRVGNDLLGQGLPYFDNTPRTQDIEQAKSLLKSAGRAGATFTLQTSAVADGYIAAATLLKQQASKAGITINLQTTSPTSYYTAPGGFITGTFRQDSYIPLSSLAAYYSEYLGPKASLNETFWGTTPGSTPANNLATQATAAASRARAAELWHEVQQIQSKQGGFLLWSNVDAVNIAGKKVRGVTENLSGYLANGNLREAWVAS